MSHVVAWFDLPVRDLSRAEAFYTAVLNTSLERDGTNSVFKHAENEIGGCLVETNEAPTGKSGTLIYFDVDGRLSDAVTAVKEHGGTVEEDKHSIEPWGFRALVTDTEGNRIALHSSSDS